MKYLLIDNCSLRDLIDQHGFSNYLIRLKELIQTGQVQFITHVNVISEWEKHKKKWEKEKSFKALGYSKRESKKAVENLLPAQHSPFINADHISVQIAEIDKLLSAASLLETPPVIEEEIGKRIKLGLAPFHNKKDSINDWEIIGSFCLYAANLGWREVYFISSNATDFGDLTDRGRIIHVDIQTRFPALSIRYFADYTEFFKSHSEAGLPMHLLHYSIVPNEKYRFKTSIKKTVLDSLFFIFTELYAEVDYVPLHLLRNYYPFASSEQSYVYYNNFTFYNVSENLIDFFKNIRVSGKSFSFIDESIMLPISNYRAKTETVLKKLTGNLIFYVSGEKSHEPVSTRYFPLKTCDCISCRSARFEFKEILEQLKIPTTHVNGKLQHAYLHYQLGNFITANQLYQEIVNETEGNKKFVSFFIAKYNQRHLSKFLQGPLTNKKVQYKLIEELEEIDPLEEAVKLKSSVDYNLLSFIAQEDYFSDAFQGVVGQVNNLRAHYNNQLNGGWGHNNYIEELLEDFLKIDTLLNNDFIVFDQYDNFKNLFNQVTEGLFISYAISPKKGSRLEKFDVYWINQLLVYGDKKRIIQLAGEYELGELENDVFDGESELLVKRFENLLACLDALQSNLEGIEENNLYLNNKLERLFETTIVMIGLLKLKRSMLNKLGEMGFKYFTKAKRRSFSFYETFDYFFKSKGKQLPVPLKRKFLKEMLFNCKTVGSRALATLIFSYTDSKKIRLDDEIFRQLISVSLKPCNKCKQIHDADALFYMLPKLENGQRIQVKREVRNALKTDFTFGLFYKASLADFISDKERVLALVAGFTPSKGNQTMGSIFGAKDEQYMNTHADELVNLSFKLNLDTTSTAFNNIRKINLYYRWLLDMEQFNYKQFDPEWTLSYQTLYYLRKMSKSKVLIKALQESLKLKSHAGIERLLLKITNFI